MRYHLPSGGRVTLLDPDQLTAKHTKAMMRRVRAMKVQPGEEVVAGVEATDYLISQVVVAWELPYDTSDGRPWVPPAEDPTLVDELRAPDYGRLLVLVHPLERVILPHDADPTEYEDHDSPTGPASESGRSSAGGPSTPRGRGSKSTGTTRGRRGGGSTGSA
jgi:hypothetical protein